MRSSLEKKEADTLEEQAKLPRRELLTFGEADVSDGVAFPQAHRHHAD